MGSRIPEETIEQIRQHFDIVDLVSEYVSLKRSGRSFMGLCPFHSEKTPSFSVVPEKQIYHCFGCGAGGNLISFYMQIEHVTFVEGIEQLAKRAGIVLPEQQGDEEDSEDAYRRKEMLRAHDLAAKYYHYALMNSEVGAAAIAYLTRRGLSKATVEQFQLGYAPDSWDFLTGFLKRRGFDERLLEEAGLASQSQKQSGRFFDKFRNRIMFPIHDGQGRVIGFGGRVMDTGEPKYLNSPETPLFQKGRHLYNLHQARSSIRQSGRAILLEGYMDVIAAFQAGVCNVVASLGTSLTPEQARILKRNANEILMMYDGDTAGQRATMRSSDVIREVDAVPRVVVLPDNLDPDEFLQRHGKEAFERVLLDGSISLTSFKLQKLRETSQLSSQDGKIKFLSEATRIISEIQSPLEREAYLRELSEEFQISLESMQREMQLRGSEQKTGDKPAKKWNTNRNNGEGMPKSHSKTPLPANIFAEKQLLSHMLIDSGVTLQVQEQLGDQFSIEEHVAIAANLYHFYSEHEDSDPALFISSMQDETLVRLASALMAESETLDFRPGIIEEYIACIHRFTVEERLREIPKEMEEAARRGDFVRLRELTQEQIQLHIKIG